MQENEEDPRKMESHDLLRSEWINKMFTLPKMFCRFDTIPVVLLVTCLTGDKKSPKMRKKVSWFAKKNGVKWITLQNILL